MRFLYPRPSNAATTAELLPDRGLPRSLAALVSPAFDRGRPIPRRRCFPIGVAGGAADGRVDCVEPYPV